MRVFYTKGDDEAVKQALRRASRSYLQSMSAVNTPGLVSFRKDFSFFELKIKIYVFVS